MLIHLVYAGTAQGGVHFGELECISLPAQINSHRRNLPGRLPFGSKIFLQALKSACDQAHHRSAGLSRGLHHHPVTILGCREIKACRRSNGSNESVGPWV